jgi:hypothetical protein
MNRYDIIGDLHGHADTLRALLVKLGYVEREGAYRHPDRQAIFVGDFIDRGPKIREVLQIVRRMADTGNALAVLGNHEWNALRYHTHGVNGQPLRAHTPKHTTQHLATLEQVAEPFPGEWQEWLIWFKSLPLFLDLGRLRVVHAAWCSRSIAEVGLRSFADEAFLHATRQSGLPGYDAVKTILVGPELDLPDGAIFLDKNGHEHRDIRVRWFRNGSSEETPTFRSLVIPASHTVPAIPGLTELSLNLRDPAGWALPVWRSGRTQRSGSRLNHPSPAHPPQPVRSRRLPLAGVSARRRILPSADEETGQSDAWCGSDHSDSGGTTDKLCPLIPAN